jgi:TolB-like protein/DNA-binding winged helix-turn-helix (wHTH) protein/Tfp pilus assembly protein PilF
VSAEEEKGVVGIQFAKDFEIDIPCYQLRRSGRVLKLERIPMEILLLLIERQGEIVTRKEIVARVWGADAFLDTDNSINGAVRKIRQVLRDDSEQPRFVQTINGKGYRFIAPVLNVQPGEKTKLDTQVLPQSTVEGLRDVSSSELEGTNQKTQVLHSRERAETPSANRSISIGAPRLIVGALAAVMLLAFIVGLLRSRLTKGPESSTPRMMLAVLPFENLTGDSSQEYFSDGMTEEMITELGNLDPERLRVIARTSVMHYKTTRVPLDQVGRELGVQYVIEGSVRRDAERIRITAQLIQTKDQTYIWAREYDRELKGALALQGEIAHEIASEIEITLGDRNPALGTRGIRSEGHYEAYDLYLRGQYFFNKRTGHDLEQAISYFEQATAKDSQYGAAYAALAASYALMGGYSGQSQTEFIPKARAAAFRALEIDDRLAEGHTALALIFQNYDWNWQGAEREFRRAIELNPNYATAHHWYAEHLMWRGRFDEALEESERARQLDPLSLIIAADNGAILFYSRQYDRAIDKWRMVLQLDHGFRRAHMIANAYVEKRRFSEAVADVDDHPEIPASALSLSAYIYGRAGRTAKARQALLDLLELNRTRPVDPMLVAWAYLGVSDKEEALAWLGKAYSQHSNELVTLKVNPGFDPLRSDPRFQRLLRRVGLAG